MGHWRGAWWDRYRVWRTEELRRSQPTLEPEAVNFRHDDDDSNDDEGGDGNGENDGHEEDEDDGQDTDSPPELPPGPFEPCYPPRGRMRFRQCPTEDWSQDWIQWDHTDCSLDSDRAGRFGDTQVGDIDDICNFASIQEDLDALHDSVQGVLGEVEELADSVGEMSTGRVVHECPHCGAISVTLRNRH